MIGLALKTGDQIVLAARHLEDLFQALRSRGYQAVGPTLRRGDLVYDELDAVADLPRGWTDEQEGGRFRLKDRGDARFFGCGLPQDNWKKFLFPSELRLWRAERRDRGFVILPETDAPPRFALIGVRPCDLNALAILDKVLLAGKYADPTYQGRREPAFIIAVNCGGHSCGVCFCVSMGAGPKAVSGFDLALTEIVEGGEHYFVAEIGTAAAAEIIAAVPQRPAQAADLSAADRVIAATDQRMGRTLDTTNLKDLIYRNYENPLWEEVAARCLTCGNCAMVCPTCFCHTIKDIADLNGEYAERRRLRDVCFSVDFSYIHGGSIRSTPRSRYRQWLTHKLATWQDQFGCLGCVGCGRCLTWCPAAIDITAAAQAIRESEIAAAILSAQENEHGYP